jgi:uncharacterized protein (DUF2235 family)
MPKNIVLLSDGTGNSAARLTKTNVWRCYEALDLSNPAKQIAIYDDGVGTSSFRPLAILGGAFGYGVKRNVLDLYTFLCRNYKAGDQIYVFGFSRGAFTACVVAGLVASEGIVPADTEELLQKNARNAYREYRRKHFNAGLPFDEIVRRLRDLFTGRGAYLRTRPSHPQPAIDFLGVWDTVGAYGLPIDEMSRAVNWFWRLYPRGRNAPSQFLRVCHALAIDDERQTFHPMLFNEENEPVRDHVDAERISQVWFAGMHSNVGGGYPDDGLSYVSFEWMLDRAKVAGLLFEDRTRQHLMLRANRVGMLYDSRKGLGGLYRYMPRKIADLCHVTDADRRVIIRRPKIHESVMRRIDLGSDRYTPIGLPACYRVANGDGTIVNAGTGRATVGAPVETPRSARRRFRRQEEVWDIVWWKRVSYFTSILIASVLFAFPLFAPYEPACQGTVLCALAPMINAAGALLPGFLEPWVAAYRSHPGAFFGFFVAFVILLAVGSRLQLKIRDRIRRLWEVSVSQPGAPLRLPPIRRSTVFNVRRSPAYRNTFELLKMPILPLFVAFIGLFIIFGLTSRFLFSVSNSAGWVCSDQLSGAGRFPACAPCWGTGYTLTEGKKYLVHLKVSFEPPVPPVCDEKGGPLLDQTIPTGLGGHAPGYLTPFVPFRRHMTENWFKPVARIRNRGNDEYVLNPVDGPRHTTTDELTAEITARRSGPLYLFLNDAVLPGPASWQYFYWNNHGTIAYDVTEIDAATGVRTRLTEQVQRPRQTQSAVN